MAKEKSSIIIKKIKKSGHAGHHGGAWKVAYADFVTAMMAFFMVMWIVGLSDQTRNAIASYFKDPIGFMQAASMGNKPFSTPNAGPGAKHGDDDQRKHTTEKHKLMRTKSAIQKAMEDAPELKGLKGNVDIQIMDEGLRIDLLENKESLFFDSGSAHVKPGTRKILKLITDQIKDMPNKVIFEGHTDIRPLVGHGSYTNWELSADRANAARKIMVENGLNSGNVGQVRGLAATQLRDPEHPTSFQNRRVSIIVAMQLHGGVDVELTDEGGQPKLQPGMPSIAPDIKNGGGSFTVTDTSGHPLGFH